MAMRLRDLEIRKVSLVPRGANQAANIVLMKHDEPSPGPDTDPTPAAAAPVAALDPLASVAKTQMTKEVWAARPINLYAGPNKTYAIASPFQVVAAVKQLVSSPATPIVKGRIQRRIVKMAQSQGPASVRMLPATWRLIKTQFTDVQSSYEMMSAREEAWDTIREYMCSLSMAIGETIFMNDPLTDVTVSIDQFRQAVASVLADLSTGAGA
jgi:hypothetical protein